MKKWEDIVKDKLEKADGALPESVFAEFQARRNASLSAPAPKRLPLVWLTVPAVAAALAAILLLRQPAAVPDSGIQLIQQPSAPLATVPDSTVAVNDSISAEQPIAHAFTPKRVQPVAAMPPQEEATEGDTAMPEVEREAPEAVVVPEAPETNSSSPFIPEKTSQPKTVKMKVGLVAGSIAGGGGLLAAAILPTIGTFTSNGTIQQQAEWERFASMDNNSTGTYGHAVEDMLPGSPVHYFPLKLGLSARIPVAMNLFVSTGIDYSLYRSTFPFTLVGEKEQQAHYLGIPVRLDWVFISGKLFDVYLGGGLEADICVGATFAGKTIQKDGLCLSLQGAGGVQFNATRHLGFYVEPQLSWRIPFGSPVLETYRTAHPLQFNVAAGVRLTIGK